MTALAEIPVTGAGPEIAAIYRDIMHHTGTGTPALIVRHFAVFPGFLQWVWQAIGDEVVSGEVLAHALDATARTATVALPSVGAGDLAAAGVDAGDRPLLDAILANYNRMNPMNLALIAAVRALLAGGGAGADAAPLPPPRAARPAPCPPLPPPVAVAAMPRDLQRTMAALAAAIPDTGAQVTPTLYRHLAIWPDLMRHLAPGLLAAMADGRVGRAIGDLRANMAPLVAHVAGRAGGRDLPAPPLADPAAMVRTLDAFLFAIPQMTVIGRAIEAALPSVPSGAAQQR